MLNPFFSFLVYQAEMIISYIFFTSIYEHRYTPIKRLLVGSLLFSIGSGVNILFHNNGYVNIAATLIINILFSKICFDSTLYKSLFYSSLLGIINAVVEVTVVSFISYSSGNAFKDYNNDTV